MLEISSTALTFDDWVGTRTVPTPGSNVGSKDLPFQSWRPFKEAFAPEVVKRAIMETPGIVSRLVDPFGGSGTSALVSQFMGVYPTTIEVNPFLADLIKAKLASYDITCLVDSFGQVMDRIQCPPAIRSTFFPGAPPTFVEPGVNGRFIFSKDLAYCITQVLGEIESLADKKTARLFRMLLATTAVELSNVLISGKGRRYKRNWQNDKVVPQDLTDSFGAKVLMAIEDISQFGNRTCENFIVLTGDTRQHLSELDEMDVAVFSPPYPNSFDYTDVYNIELWILGYLTSSVDNRQLREATLRSHVQIKRDFSARKLRSHTLSLTLKKLAEVRNQLWNKNIPEMVAAYFDDMFGVMASLNQVLRTKGRIYCVVGDSKYASISVPVAKILTQISRDTGLTYMGAEKFRSMRSSPQQGGRKELSETLLIFEKG